jgi:hypothetical protein
VVKKSCQIKDSVNIVGEESTNRIRRDWVKLTEKQQPYYNGHYKENREDEALAAAA